MDDIEKAVFVENPRGYLKAWDGNMKLFKYMQELLLLS